MFPGPTSRCIAALADVSFIAKSDTRRLADLSARSVRLQRTVFVERERKRKSGEQASEIAQRLAAGDAMVLFAEGSTGDGNMHLPFKSTLFGAADDGDRGGRGGQGLHPAGGHHLHARAWHADGPAAPSAGCLDRRQRPRAASQRACCAKARSTSRCISASRSSSTRGVRPQGGDPADGSAGPAMMVSAALQRSRARADAEQDREIGCFLSPKGG